MAGWKSNEVSCRLEHSWNVVQTIRDKVASRSLPPQVSNNADRFGCFTHIYKVEPIIFPDKKGIVHSDLSLGSRNNNIIIPEADVPMIIQMLQDTYNTFSEYTKKGNKYLDGIILDKVNEKFTLDD